MTKRIVRQIRKGLLNPMEQLMIVINKINQGISSFPLSVSPANEYGKPEQNNTNEYIASYIP